MSLAPGTRLGPYEIVAPLGAGGMGEVYRARDSRLGRDVAVKVLPAHLSDNAEVRARFEREAKTVSSLNHPHICTLFDVGREGETDYLVMELVEGETLAQRLGKGALSLVELLRLGGQIADALSRAHRAGVIHRDLKPGNVMLTKGSAGGFSAKLMDFGLARATGLLGASGSGVSGVTMAALTQSPTVAQPLTAEGTLVGTYQYMAPEQLEGAEADARTDIWALGCVLYEMATGTRPFGGKSQASLISSILKDEPPPLAERAPSSPPALERIIRHCLAKEPDDRIQTAHDVRLQLEGLAPGGPMSSFGSSGALPLPALPARPTARWRGLAPIATGAVALAVGLYAGARFLPPGGGRAGGTGGATTARVTAVSQLTNLPGRQYAACLSPDGKMLLYVAGTGGNEDIFLQRVGGENATNLTESFDGADYDPAFSPDGERIAFCSARDGGGIFVMGATGESPRKVTEGGAHPTWSPDGRRIAYSTERVPNPFSRTTTASLRVVDVATGEQKRIYEGDAVQPAWSPSGQRIAFMATEKGQRDVCTISAEGGTVTPVTADVPADWEPFWAHDGRSLFFLSDRGGNADLWRVAINEASGAPGGAPTPVTTGVASVMSGSVSADGQRVAIVVNEARSELLKLAFDPVAGRSEGTPTRIFASSNAMTQPALSPDGGWIAWRTVSPREDLFVMRSDGTDRRRLTDDTFRNRGPQWVRGSEWLVFYSNRGGGYDIWLMRADGTQPRQITKHTEGDVNQPTITRDGTRLAATANVGGVFRLAMAQVDDSWFAPGPGPAPAQLETLVEGFYPGAWSPDGQRILGTARTPEGSVPSVYDVATRRFEPRADLAGLLSASTWLPDSRHLLAWDARRKTAVLWDADSRDIRDVPGIPGPAELKLSADGRTLVANHTELEGDVWLLTLQ